MGFKIELFTDEHLAKSSLLKSVAFLRCSRLFVHMKRILSIILGLGILCTHGAIAYNDVPTGRVWAKVRYDNNTRTDLVADLGAEYGANRAACNNVLPVLCISKSNQMPNPGLSTDESRYWSGSQIWLAPPVAGNSFSNANEVDLYCEQSISPDARAAQAPDTAFYDRFFAFDSHAKIPDQARFWILPPNGYYSHCWDRPNRSARMGLTGSLMSHDAALGVDQIYPKGDPKNGDTACSTSLPILCINQDETPNPDPKKMFLWMDGKIKLTPTVRGDSFSTLAQANAFCSLFNGPGYRVAEFHDAQGIYQGGLIDNSSGMYAYGDIGSASRFWIDINDQNATCWDPAPPPLSGVSPGQAKTGYPWISDLSDPANGVQRVRMDGDNPSSCMIKVPVLCMKKNGKENITQPLLPAWAAEDIDLSYPISGTHLQSHADMDEACIRKLGSDWQAATTQDGRSQGIFHANGTLPKDTLFWVYDVEGRYNCWQSPFESTAHTETGMTWAKIPFSASQGVGVERVGIVGGNPFRGDTLCSESLPVLCVEKLNLPRPNVHSSGWIGGNLKLAPSVTGSSFKTAQEVDIYCALNAGPNYRVAEFHDGNPGEMRGYGNLDSSSRFWVDIKDQNANCWKDR